MSNVVIGGTATGATALPVANTIDGTNDLLPIYTASATATQAISRSTLLGVTGQPADISSTQTISNKTLNNTNTVTLKDTLVTLQNTADTTKQAKFQLSGITTGTTRTYTLPDISDTLVTLTSAQTLTNKTLTGPTINAPNITNASITADTVSGFTTSNSGTIYGIPVATGVINTANTINGASIVAASVGSTALNTNAVQSSQIATNAITLGYTQITTNFSSASTTYVQVTSLTTTVTIPSGGRKIKITAFTPGISNTNASTGNFLSIWDGTVGSGTQLTYCEVDETSATFNGFAMAVAVVTPSAGSKTYNVGFKTTAGTGTVVAMTTGPAFILVEAI